MGLNVDQELFGVFAFYNAVVILKMLLMAFLTARWILMMRLIINGQNLTFYQNEQYTTRKNEQAAHSNLDVDNYFE